MPRPRSTNQVKLSDIADALNVSVSSVSLGLRNSPKISGKLTEEIHRMAKKMNYHPNALAVGLAKAKQAEGQQPSKAGLAWINFWKDPSDMRRYQEYARYWKGARDAAKAQGFNIEEFVINDELTPTRLDGILRSRNIEGVVIPPHPKISEGTNLLLNMDWSKRAVVKLGYSISNLAVHTVTSNHVQCSQLAMERMRAKGYQRIGYAGRRTKHTQFVAGMLMCQAELDEALRIPVFESPSDDFSGSSRRIKSWIREHNPDAVLSDYSGIRELLESAGCRIPEEIGLASTSIFDGNANAGLNQNSHEIGKVAVNQLIAMIYRREFGIPELPQEILVKGSWQDGSDLPGRNV